MKIVAIVTGALCALSITGMGSGLSARAAEVPAEFKAIVGTQTAPAAEIGTKDVLQLIQDPKLLGKLVTYLGCDVRQHLSKVRHRYPVVLDHVGQGLINDG